MSHEPTRQRCRPAGKARTPAASAIIDPDPRSCQRFVSSLDDWPRSSDLGARHRALRRRRSTRAFETSDCSTSVTCEYFGVTGRGVAPTKTGFSVFMKGWAVPSDGSSNTAGRVGARPSWVAKRELGRRRGHPGDELDRRVAVLGGGVHAVLIAAEAGGALAAREMRQRRHADLADDAWTRPCPARSTRHRTSCAGRPPGRR